MKADSRGAISSRNYFKYSASGKETIGITHFSTAIFSSFEVNITTINLKKIKKEKKEEKKEEEETKSSTPSLKHT